MAVLTVLLLLVVVVVTAGSSGGNIGGIADDGGGDASTRFREFNDVARGPGGSGRGAGDGRGPRGGSMKVKVSLLSRREPRLHNL